MLRTITVRRIVLLLGLGLGLSGNQASTQVLSVARAKSSRGIVARPATTVSLDECLMPSKGRECVRAALQRPDGSSERSSMLGIACKAGYDAACFFLEPRPKAESARAYYNRRACAFGLRGACSEFAGALRDEYPHEQGWVTQVTRLTLEYATSVEVIAHPGAKLTFLESEGEWAWVLVLSFDTQVPRAKRSSDPSDTWNAPVLARLPRQALSSVEIPLREPVIQYNTRDFDRSIFGSPESTDIGVKLRCGPIQILADLPGGVQQLRQVYEGIEVRGYTPEAIEWNWGTYNCWPRVTRLTSPPWHRDPPPKVPLGQIPVDSRQARQAARYIRAGHLLYQLWLGNSSGLECAEVSFSPDRAYIHPPPGKGKARTEVTRYGGFSEEGFATFRGSRWDVSDEQGKGYVASPVCESHMTLLRESESTIEFIEDKELFAYHPDDVSRWYKTKAACESAIAKTPRIRVLPSAQGVALQMSVRLNTGC